MRSLAKRIRDKERNEHGFTLVEIVVAIGIVAILAAIAIPVVMHYRDAGTKAEIQTALTDASTEIHVLTTKNNGMLVTTPGDFSRNDVSVQYNPTGEMIRNSEGDVYASTSYCLQGSKDGFTYRLLSDGNQEAVEGTC